MFGLTRFREPISGSEHTHEEYRGAKAPQDSSQQ